MIVCAWGGGVQSTAINLIHKHQPELLERIGLVPEHYIFADPGAELAWTDRHIDRLLKHGHFAAPLHRVSGGDILADKGNRTLPPFHVMGEDGKKSILMRKCTRDLKVVPVERKARELAGLKGKRSKPGAIKLLLGISMDEVERMKPGRGAFENRYPLIELRWDRRRCVAYCTEILGYKVEKSACFMCPYRRDWARLKELWPWEWERAVAYDKSLRDGSRCVAGTTQERYLHRFLVPLEEALAMEQSMEITKGQPMFEDFLEECEGHCGV